MTRVRVPLSCALGAALLSGCGPASGDGASDSFAGGEGISVALPAEPPAPPTAEADDAGNLTNLGADADNVVEAAPTKKEDIKPIPKPRPEKPPKLATTVDEGKLPVPPKEEPAAAPAAGPSTSSGSSPPLGNATIARTLDRIGFRCGSVVGSSQIGEESAWKIDCSSGASYRASPRSGRIRFRKWTG